MTDNDKKILAEFETRMRQLMYLCDSLKEENTRLGRELTEKNTEIRVLTSEIKELKTKYDNLRFAKSFSSGNQEEMQNAKNRLSKLVRDVDRCIAILKK